MTEPLNNNCIVLSHVLVQSPNESVKYEIMEKTIDTFRILNPDSYIILTGHGGVLPTSIQDKVDYAYWEPAIRTEQFGSGHPFFVRHGYQHAQEQGFTHAFKARTDCPSLLKNVCTVLHKILSDEGTEMVVTDMTSFKNLYIGDLFLYGPLEVLLKSWDNNRWDCNHGGLQNYANIWMEDHGYPRNHLSNPSPPHWWRKLLVDTVSFRVVEELKCINLEDFWGQLQDVDLVQIQDTDQYAWGARWNYPHQLNTAEFYEEKRKHNDQS